MSEPRLSVPINPRPTQGLSTFSRSQNTHILVCHWPKFGSNQHHITNMQFQPLILVVRKILQSILAWFLSFPNLATTWRIEQLSIKSPVKNISQCYQDSSSTNIKHRHKPRRWQFFKILAKAISRTQLDISVLSPLHGSLWPCIPSNRQFSVNVSLKCLHFPGKASRRSCASLFWQSSRNTA